MSTSVKFNAVRMNGITQEDRVGGPVGAWDSRPLERSKSHRRELATRGLRWNNPRSAASQKLSPESISRRGRCATAEKWCDSQLRTSHVLALGQFYFILNNAMWAEPMSALLMLYTQCWAQHLAQYRLQDTAVTKNKEIRTNFRYL